MKTSRIVLSVIMLLGLLVAPHALAEPPECSDAIDNDGDGHPDDPDCDLRSVTIWVR